ncbi:MAG: hypothetical protein D6718_02955 [Acidobacteria bacterium]|nr:MAG: hypothetical protein D6718_02955 [Acidobacteriota bacterium]
MKNVARVLLFVAAASSALAGPPSGGTVRLVAAAPGYPGTTETAQPTMDRFALALASGLGWPPGRLTAVYDPDEDSGAARIADESTVLALVPLPFYLAHRAELRLDPLLVASRTPRPAQVWSLVAAKGAASGPADLGGWRVAGSAGYAPAFVRGVLFDSLPPDVEIVFSSRVLSLLRRAAAGEKVAVLLDEAQAGGVASLSFGGKLAVVARSAPVPEALLCAVRGRLATDDRTAVKEAVMRLDEQSRELLSAMQIRRFFPVDEQGLAAVERAFDEAR